MDVLAGDGTCLARIPLELQTRIHLVIASALISRIQATCGYTTWRIKHFDFPSK